MKLSLRWLQPTAFICLLLSGLAGLVYQVVWTRYLALLLGHTSYAVVAVLVAFMGGLALGNAWLGRLADRTARPLALYAWLEIGIAVYAFLFPLYFELGQRAYVALGRGSVPGGLWLQFLKILLSLAIILVPTTLMGGTLPVMTRLVTRSLGELRARVAGLYFINSLGAVLGVLVADFWWIPTLGLDTTILGGAIVNATVGVIGLLVATGLPPEDSRAPDVSDETKSTAGFLSMSAPNPDAAQLVGTESYTESELRLAIAAAGVSGFVAMLYEVVWTRLLALALGSSTHAFSIMLVTFISGIATGAWCVSRWRRLRRTFDAFGWAELALALTLATSMFFYHWLPFAFVKLGAMVARAPENHILYQAAQFLLCFAVMFIPTLCLGMTLPLASRVATTELARTGRSVGRVFSVNTLGTVMGAAVAGFVLLPALGLARAFAVGVGLNLVIALAVLLRRVRFFRSAIIWTAPLVVLAMVGMAQVCLGGLWERAFSLGLWRVNSPPATPAAFRDTVNALGVRYHRDGAGATVMVHSWTNGATGKVELTLRVNGKADATTRGDMPTQLLTGHIPLLLKTNVEDVMVVGIGSGMTCGAVLTHPGVRHVDAIEISPEVRDVARTWFAPFNRRALEDPRVEVILDDAKSFLRTSGRTYDVIISEPSNPWMAGVAGVFSLEYYEACRSSLRPGGLMAQWVQIYESNDETLSTVLATFTAVFPYSTLWQTLPGDLMLIGSTTPLRCDLEATRRQFEMPAVNEDLRRADLFTLPVLLGLQLVSEANTPFLVSEDTSRHSDFFPVLEYQAERGFFARDRTTLQETFNEEGLRRPTTWLGEYLREHPLTVADAQSFALFHTSFQLPAARILRTILERWRELDPESTLVAEFSAKLDFPLPVSELEAQRMTRVRDRMLEHASEELEPLRIYSRHLMHAYRAQRSVYYQPPSAEVETVLKRLVEVDSEHRQSHLLRLAEIAWDQGDDERFFRLATDAFLQKAGAPAVGKFDLDYQAPGRVLFRVIETLWRNGDFAGARMWAEAARDGGYLETASRYYNEMLAMVVRKVEATMGEQGPPASPKQQTPTNGPKSSG